MPLETSTANISRSRGGVDIWAQTWRADRSRTGDWSARGTNPLTTSRTGRWFADPNRFSPRSPDSERRLRCRRKSGLSDAAPYRCPATTSSSNSWRACAIRLSIWRTPTAPAFGETLRCLLGLVDHGRSINRLRLPVGVSTGLGQHVLLEVAPDDLR